MSANKEKMAVLDEGFNATEQAKNAVERECSGLNKGFKDILKIIKSSKGTDLEPVLKKMKSFLDSGVTTMQSIESDLKAVIGDCAKTQQILRSMGA